MKPYGMELILDLHGCDASTFSRVSIRRFFHGLCERIDMEPCRLCWWNDHGLPSEECQTEPHLKGTSAVQFILTSNIVIHTLDALEKVYLNIFSCKEFDADVAKNFAEEWFQGKTAAYHVIERL